MEMTESIEPLGFSARLRTALCRYADFPHRSGITIENVIEEYRQDPQAFTDEFLRIPGAGRVSLNELLDFFDRVGDDGNYAGRVIAIRVEQAEVSRKAIDEACHYISASSPLYSRLRDIERWLTAGTLHIQQPGDERAMFKVVSHGR